MRLPAVQARRQLEASERSMRDAAGQQRAQQVGGSSGPVQAQSIASEAPPKPPTATPATTPVATPAAPAIITVTSSASHTSHASDGAPAVPHSLPIADAVWDPDEDAQVGTLVAVASCANTSEATVTASSATSAAGSATASVPAAGAAGTPSGVHELVANATPISGAPTVDGAVVQTAVDARFVGEN